MTKQRHGINTEYIDKRSRSEATEYAVSIAAEVGDLGHAFIVFNKGDDTAKMTVQQTLGFYPQTDKNNYEAIFGYSKGQILDDSMEKPDYKLIVLVNSEAYNAATVVLNKWSKAGNYLLGFSDCTSFVGEIGNAIGLNMPSRIFAPYPIEYVKGIKERN